MVKVKICGITNLEDAISAVAAGCDALGFVFYIKSPRYINPRKAKNIIKIIPKNILKIGVFVNSEEKAIRRIARFCGLDILQFHAQESAKFCKKFMNYKVIKAFRVKGEVDLPKVLEYDTYAYMFDTFKQSKYGGTGRIFNWKLLAGQIKRFKKSVFLSGGLNEKNVKQAIKLIQPQWVDVSSAVEIRPGKKDREKIQRFIRAAKRSDF